MSKKQILTSMPVAAKHLPAKWRKHYQGQSYYFRGDYETALRLWEAKKVQLDNGLGDNYYTALIEKIGEDAETEPQAKQRWASISTEGRAVLLDRIHQQEAKPKGKTVADHIKDYLESKKTQVATGKIRPCSWDNTRCRIKWFTDWIGDKQLTDINEKTLVDFHAYIVGQLTTKRLSHGYAQDVMRDVFCFLKSMWELRILNDLPRNLGNKALSIPTQQHKIKTFTKEEIQNLFSKAGDRLKLCLLLFLNAGMYQIDVATIRPEEVDWERGTITRKRTKTAQCENTPVVTYKLWNVTFDLLKRLGSRSGEYVLLNSNGLPLLYSKLDGDKIRKSDCVKNDYWRLCKKIGVVPKPMKLLRKTGATALATKYPPNMVQYYLGHSPRTIADKHYAAPSDENFAEALKWLGEQYGF